MILSPDKAVQDSIHYLQSYLQENNDGAGNSEDSTNDAKTGARVARTGTSEPPAASRAAPWMFPPEPSTATQRDPAPRTPHRRTTARASATTSTTTLSARGDVEGSFTETVNHLRQSWRTPDSPHRPRHHPFSPQCRRPINRPAYSMDSTPNHRLRSGAVPLFSHDDAAARWSLPSAIARPSVSLGSAAAYAASPLLSRPTHADPFRRVPVLRYSHSRSPLREVYPPSLSRRSSLPLGYSDAVAPPIMGRPPRVVPATSPPSMVVPETPVRARRHGAPPPPQPDSPSPSPRRAAPSLPLREEDANPPHTHDSFDVHDRSLSTIAEYLKNYYACDVDEPTKCVETLMPDDVLNLAQCFYVDLHRRVRSRRDAAGMDTSSFLDAEPQVHDVERSVPRYPADSLEPPPPPPPPSTESGHNRRKIPLGKPSSTNARNARDSEQDVCSPSPPANSRGTDSSQRIEAVLPVFVKPFDHSPSPSAPSPSGASKHPSLSHPPPTDDYSRQVVACCPSPPYGVWGGRPTTTEVSTDDVFRHRRATPAAPSPSSTKPVVPPSSIKPAAVPAATRAATPPDSSGRRHVMILDGRRTPSDRESSVVSHRTQTPQDPRTHSTLSSSGSPRRPGRRGSANDVRILKRPLRELMPLLRRGTVLCRYSDDDHAPEARFFRVDDRRAMFHHKEVLMPHLVWAAIPKDLPQSLHALNLTDLIGVSVGPSVHTHPSRPWYHRRGSRTVVNDRDEAVPLPWCCILQFRQQSIAVAFYNEEDRQTWVGAMMGVVERNRELGM